MLKEIFVSLYERGKSYEEIAEIMGITESSISGRVERYKKGGLITEDSVRIRNQNIQNIFKEN